MDCVGIENAEERIDMINERLYKDCKTGRDVINKFTELDAEEENDRYWIHKLMACFDISCREASKQFYSFGMSSKRQSKHGNT